MELKYLSSGGQGILLHNENQVFKYGLKKNLIKEYEFIKNLPNLDCFYRYSFVSLNDVDTEKMKEIDKKYSSHECLLIRDYLLRNETEYASMTMDYIQMNPLSSLLKIYKPFINKIFISPSVQFICRFGDVIVIEENKFINLIRSIYKLYNNVYVLNNMYKMYHNDITEFNIMCSESGDEMYLIDFGMSAKTDFGCFNDLSNTIDILKIIINIGLSNNDIYNRINDIIKLDELIKLFYDRENNINNWIKIIELFI